MKVPVFVGYSKIEELCDPDEQEGIICDDFKGYKKWGLRGRKASPFRAGWIAPL